MNLVVLQGRKPPRLNGNEEQLEFLYGLLSQYEPKNTGDESLSFITGMLESLSSYVSTKDGSKKHLFLDYQALDFENIEQLAWGAEIVRIAISHFPEDIKFTDYDPKEYPEIWMGTLRVNIDSKSSLGQALLNIAGWDWFHNGKTPNFFRLALLGLDFAWRAYKGFTIPDGGFLWFDKKVQTSSYLDWFMGKKTDRISKEMKAATDKYISANKNAAENRDLIINTADKIEKVYNNVINAVGDETFKVFGTLQAGVATLPMALVLGIRPKNKAAFGLLLAASAVPLVWLGKNVINYPASTQTKAVFGGGGAMLGFGVGFGMGYGIRATFPNLSEAGKTIVRNKVGLNGRRRRRLK